MSHWCWADAMRTQRNLGRFVAERRAPRPPIAPKPGGRVFTLTPESLAAWSASPEGQAMKEDNERRGREGLRRAYDELDTRAAMQDPEPASRDSVARNLTLVK